MTDRDLAIETLRGSTLGSGLDEAVLQQLLAVSQLQNHPSGASVLHQQGEANAVYLPCSGMIMIERTAYSGDRQVIDFLSRGDYLGFTSTGQYLYSASTLLPCLLIKFPRGRFDDLCEETPQLKQNVARITNLVLSHVMDHLFAIGQKRAHERLGFLIHAFFQRFGTDTENVIQLPMNRTDIGDYLGLTLETTSRAFTRLRKEGVISTPDHHSVVIEDLEALQELADVE